MTASRTFTGAVAALLLFGAYPPAKGDPPPTEAADPAAREFFRGGILKEGDNAALGQDVAAFSALMEEFAAALRLGDLSRVEDLHRQTAELLSPGADGDPVRQLFVRWHEAHADDLARVRRDPALAPAYQELLIAVSGWVDAEDDEGLVRPLRDLSAALARIDEVVPVADSEPRGLWYERAQAGIFAIDARLGPPGTTAARAREVVAWNARVKAAGYPITSELIYRRRDLAKALFREGRPEAARELWFEVIRDSAPYGASDGGKILDLDAVGCALACSAAQFDLRGVCFYAGLMPFPLDSPDPYDLANPLDRAAAVASYLQIRKSLPESRAIVAFLSAEEADGLSEVARERMLVPLERLFEIER